MQGGLEQVQTVGRCRLNIGGNGWLYEMCGFKSGIPSRYMNVNVGDELTIMVNG